MISKMNSINLDREEPDAHDPRRDELHAEGDTPELGARFNVDPDAVYKYRSG
jgi:hypothetical protein